MTRLVATLDAFDALNAEDPEHVDVDGESVPAQVAYARRMTAWLQRVQPDASECLQLAVRAQHICRWTIPRAEYPTGRAGYKRWRTALAARHREIAAGVMREQGYDDATIDRVGDLIQKKRLKLDPETQALEDTACLVFLEHYFAAFAAAHPDDKLIDVVRKTWNKMSDRGHQLALTLDLDPRSRAIIDQALTSGT